MGQWSFNSSSLLTNQKLLQQTQGSVHLKGAGMAVKFNGRHSGEETLLESWVGGGHCRSPPALNPWFGVVSSSLTLDHSSEVDAEVHFNTYSHTFSSFI